MLWCLGLGFLVLLFFLVTAPHRIPDRQSLNNSIVTRLSLAQAWRIKPAFINCYSWLLSFFLPLLFVITISSFSQEQTWFPPEALIPSSCIAFTADDASEHVRSPPEGKYSEQPVSQAKFTTKIYSKRGVGWGCGFCFVLVFCFWSCFAGVWLLCFNISGKYTIATAHAGFGQDFAHLVWIQVTVLAVYKSWLCTQHSECCLSLLWNHSQTTNARKCGKYRIKLSWQTAPFSYTSKNKLS